MPEIKWRSLRTGEVSTDQEDAEVFSTEHRCRDFDEDCKDIPGKAPDGHQRSYCDCWLHDPARGWCPFLRDAG
jgi:hypothetical protein